MPRRAGYHHGDLKAALVESALALIAERGVAALSVAEVARRGGQRRGAVPSFPEPAGAADGGGHRGRA